MTMQLGLSESLPALVSRRFTAAKEGGHLTFSPTQLAIIQASGISVGIYNATSIVQKLTQANNLFFTHSQFQLRYCPSLAKKPTTTAATEPKPTNKKPDPFANPSEDLLIATGIGNGKHTLVLNKFPIIRNHFIMATREWKAQDHLLDADDLAATYACLQAWSGPSPLFAFYNSGPESGASQPHRHVQFVPVEAMRNEQQNTWDPLIDHVHHKADFGYIPNLPFAHFALSIPKDPSAETLHSIYLALYKAAVTAAQQDKPAAATEIKGSTAASISYNLSMTTSTMLICPRRSEKATLAAAEVTSGEVSLNGTILAGTLMVKNENEWMLLRNDPQLLADVLVTVGYPRRGPSAL